MARKNKKIKLNSQKTAVFLEIKQEKRLMANLACSDSSL